MKKRNFTFDELDLKVLKELPLISEVLSSTINKLSDFLRPISEQLSTIIKNEIPKGWELEKRQYNNIIFPFTSVDLKDKVVQLENYFQITTEFTLIRREEKKWLDKMVFSLGFYYSDEYELTKMPYFYFNFSRDPSPKFGGQMFPLSYFEVISASNPAHKFYIQHPDSGNDEESIELMVMEYDPDLIQKAAEFFLDDIVLKILTEIPQARLKDGA